MSYNSGRRNPTPAQIFLEEKYPDIIGKLKIFAKNDMGDDSAEPTTDERHILYFEPFMNHQFEIGEQIFVRPKQWALAFMQEDLPSATKQLCKAVLDHTHQALTIEYRRCIQKAAMWIMQKRDQNLDPWSYSILSEVPEPTNDQQREMDTAIESYSNEINSLNGNEPYQVQSQNLETSLSTSIDENFNDVFHIILRELELVSSVEDVKDIYDQIFKAFMEEFKGQASRHMTAVEIVSALTKSTIPINNDIFIDAVQISNNRFTRAGTESTLEEISKSLSKPIIFRDVVRPRKRFQSVNDLCPVKRLALYRASMFLLSVKRGSISARTTDFNPQITEHNLYPSEADRAKIDNGIMEALHFILRREGLTIDALKIDDTDNFPEFMPPGPSQASFIGNEQNEEPFINFLNRPVSSNALFQNNSLVDNHSSIVPPPMIPKIEIAGHIYPVAVWEAAKTKYLAEGIVAAGYYLFLELFTDYEKKFCCIKGKKGERKLPEEKINAVLDAVQYFDENVSPTPQNWTKDTRKIMRTSIIIEKSYLYRKTAKEAKKM